MAPPLLHREATVAMLFQRKKVIGIDLSGDAPTAVLFAFNQRLQKPVVLRYVMLSGEDGVQSLTDVVRTLIQKLRTRCRDCALAAWPDGARVKFFEAPKNASTAALRVQLRSGGKHVLNEQLDGYVLDCDKLEGYRGSTDEDHFISCGVPRVEQATIEAVFVSLGLRLHVFQLSPIALFNAFITSQDEVVAKEAYLVVDIAENRTIIIGGHRKRVPLVRILDFGWGALGKAFTTETPKPAELMEVLFEKGGPELEAAQNVTQHLGAELQRSADFLRIDQRAHLEKIHLSGTVNIQAPVVKMLSDVVDLSFEHWNPCRRAVATDEALADFNLLKDSARLPCAAGAAFQYLL